VGRLLGGAAAMTNEAACQRQSLSACGKFLNCGAQWRLNLAAARKWSAIQLLPIQLQPICRSGDLASEQATNAAVSPPPPPCRGAGTARSKGCQRSQ